MAQSEYINEGFIIGSRADMVLLGKAIRENWQMTEACRESIVSQLKDIYTNDRRDRWRLRAMRLIQLMSEQNAAVAVE